MNIELHDFITLVFTGICHIKLNLKILIRHECLA